MTTKPNQRNWRNYFIRRDVQQPIVFTNLIFLFATLGLLIVVLLSPLYIDMLTSEDFWIQQVTGNLFLILLKRIAIAMLAVMALAGAHQLIFSHRFCGPLINFGHTFEKMVQCDFSRKIHLRKNDFLKEEADQVNTVIDRLQADGTTLTQGLEQCAQLLEKLDTQELSDEARQIVQALAEPVDRMQATVGAWTLAGDDEAMADQPAAR